MLQVLSMAALRQGMQPAPDTQDAAAASSLKRNQDWNPASDPETWDLIHRDEEGAGPEDPYLKAYKDTLIITIKGIASGMQNTG